MPRPLLNIRLFHLMSRDDTISVSNATEGVNSQSSSALLSGSLFYSTNV